MFAIFLLIQDFENGLSSGDLFLDQSLRKITQLTVIFACNKRSRSNGMVQQQKSPYVYRLHGH